MRSLYLLPVIVLALMAGFFIGCTRGGEQSGKVHDYPITPVPFTQVTLNDNFWLPRILTNTDVTIPIAFEQSEQTGRIKNFEIAGGMKDGSFCGIYAFDDSDVYKIIEGASYSLMIKPDPELDAYLDSLIYKISLAQEDDGYLYTNRTIMGDSALPMAGKKRWENESEHSHELYNAGHLYEAAVAHFQATGKRTLLEVAIKNADLIDREFGWGKIEKYPGHQEIEIGLVKLYRITGEIKYLNLAKFFLDVRGPGGWEYNQAHMKVVDQQEPIGHAVRALYMYSAMADVATLTGDLDYLKAIQRIWDHLARKKIYVTGGVGQSGSNEGFGPDYELPNKSAYCETCASIANVLWNHRMFLLSGDSKYIDVMERTLYNALLSGVSLTGNRFFYPNPLESAGDDERKAWFGCACCPSNISRFLPSVPGYVYAQSQDRIYVNLFIAGETRITTAQGTFHLTLQGSYPWKGEIVLEVNPEQSARQMICIRIPGWTVNNPIPGDLYSFYEMFAEKPTAKLNGTEIPLHMKQGYATIDREWQRGDQVKISFPMPVRKIIAHDSVAAGHERFALQRGPMVFCIEDRDNPGGQVRHVLADIDGDFHPHFNSPLMKGIQQISFEGRLVRLKLNGDVVVDPEIRQLEAIPYAYWANRGKGQMLVWIPYATEYATPLPAPTIAFRSAKSAPGSKGNIELLADQYQPEHAADPTMGYIHWWPLKDTTVAIEYLFAQPENISHTKVYWFDDGPDGGCRIPREWALFYREGGDWKPVTIFSRYTITKNDFDIVKFKPVTTDAMRLEITLQPDFSGGVHEWCVR